MCTRGDMCTARRTTVRRACNTRVCSLIVAKCLLTLQPAFSLNMRAIPPASETQSHELERRSPDSPTASRTKCAINYRVVVVVHSNVFIVSPFGGNFSKNNRNCHVESPLEPRLSPRLVNRCRQSLATFAPRIQRKFEGKLIRTDDRVRV